MKPGTAEPVRVARVISRLNIGGPAIQAITLTKELEPRGYRTLLIRGREREHEGTMDDLAHRLGVRPVEVPTMYREIGMGDALAFRRIATILRAFRPHVVHTHAAKAGTLGRAAALAALPDSPPMLVHTYHGHSLSGYWGGPKNAVFSGIERVLGRRTDHLVAVSDEVRAELVGYGVSARRAFHVVPLGFDLERFAPERFSQDDRARTRQELGLPERDPLVVLVARLVPIKRVDRFLRIANRIARLLPDTRFAVVGDGELSAELQGGAEAGALGDRVAWVGFRRDVASILACADVVVQTSDNEGTPVSLIEASASSRAIVSTDVGGTRSVIRHGETGYVVDRDDEEGFAGCVAGLLRDSPRRSALGQKAREHALGTFTLGRLVDDVDNLYRGGLRSS